MRHFGALLLLLSVTTASKADILLQTADAGVPDPSGSGGFIITDNFYAGFRFRVDQTTQLDAIGGYFDEFLGDDSPPESIFAAIVDLPHHRALPSTEISPDEVLGATLIQLPTAEQGLSDVIGEIDLTLDPGWYAAVYGSGKYGATGRADVFGENPNSNRDTELFRIRRSDSSYLGTSSVPRLFLEGSLPSRRTVELIASVDGQASGAAQGYTVADGSEEINVTESKTSDFRRRGVLEFDLSVIPPNATIESAIVDVDVYAYDAGDDRSTLRYYGYAGDGFLANADANGDGPLLGESSPIFSPADSRGTALDTAYIESLLGESNYLGLTVAPGENGNTAIFSTTEFIHNFGLQIPEAIPPTLTLQISTEVASLVGDFDGSGNYEPTDIYLMCVQQGSSAGDFDLDGSGIVDLADLDLLLQSAGSLHGDTDLNGQVEFADFLKLSSAFGGNADWEDGDSNCDGTVDFGDFLRLSDNFGKTSAASVPEPSGRLMLLIALVGLACVRRW